VPHIRIAKLGAALGALALILPAATAAAQQAAPASPSGGLTYDDPSAPTVFADGSTLAAPLGQLLGGVVRFHGTLAGSQPGDDVVVQALDTTAGWVDAATATVDQDGAFDAAWKPSHAGRTSVRVVPAGSDQATARSATTDSAPARDLTVFRPATVTWYGPGFYGHKTACGQKLTHKLLGVAHRTLPCGTLVQLFYNGRTVTVPVVDRGPFRRGTRYDLTSATAKALGVTATTVVGALRAAPTPAP
jgi:hypothetical protein